MCKRTSWKRRKKRSRVSTNLDTNFRLVLVLFSYIANLCELRYNYSMRKKRSDRNYILYRLTGPSGADSYIGLTVAVGSAIVRSVKVRVQKHISRAVREDKDWSLCAFLRSTEVVHYEVLEVIRGRKNAYQRERELIREYTPNLNDF
jgi:hypothetical protein